MSQWRMAWDEDGNPAPTGDDERLRLSDVGKLGRRMRRGVVGAARAHDQPGFGRLLAEHLGPEVADLRVVEESWPSYDHVNVQAGLDAWLAEEGRRHQLVGMARHHDEFGISDLVHPDPHRYGPAPGNVSFANVASGPGGAVKPVVRAGLYLVTDGEGASAVLLTGADPRAGVSGLAVQVVANRDGVAESIAQRLRELSLTHNVFRGQVLSFGQDMFGERGAALRFHTRPHVTEADVVLPAETLAMIRRQVVGVAEHRERLLAARQHLKRGLLLFGPPGVGKTHSVRWLISMLSGVTIIELSGDSLMLIGEACSVARTLQPAMIVVEDVDLIAEDRGMHPGQHPLLFQLLNQMDGLAEDADVVFLLTTNRADVLEPALASRPGRIDQAVAMELPDVQARRRLFDLYRGDLVIDESNLDSVIERTEGVTASFLKELVRRAALMAAEGGGSSADSSSDSSAVALEVSAGRLDAALEELLDTRNAMTRVLLGGGGGSGTIVSGALAEPGLSPGVGSGGDFGDDRGARRSPSRYRDDA